MTAVRVKVLERGKLILPSALRKQFNIAQGDTVLVDAIDNKITIETTRDMLARVRALIRTRVAEGDLLSDELVAERREAALNE